MKTFFLKSSLIALSLAATVVSCGSDDNTDILKTPGEEAPEDPTGVTKSATIKLTEGGATDDIFFAEATGKAGESTKGRVIFTTTDSKQRRLYATKTMPGGTPEPVIVAGLDKKGTKPDGSIDLDKDIKKELDFTFDLEVPTDMTNGEIIYNFWSTTGKGDFRNPEKRKLIGVGTIAVKIGTGINPNAQLLSFPGIKLFAPDSEGKFDTFFSLFTGEASKINEGPEFRAFWDFGYYYGASGIAKDDKASLVSVKEFETEFPFPVDGLKPGVDEEDAANETLNEAFFALSSKTSAEFDVANISSDFNDITKPTATNVTNLKIGDIVEFVDNYGNIGLIKVADLQEGFNNDDFIIIDVKVQPSAPVMSK